jgi:transcriptional regulator with XRE-family HTH domain
MADDLTINQQTYSRWELGDRQPKLQDLAAIALHFGVTTDWLLGLSDSRDNSEATSDCTWRKRALAAEQKLERINRALGHALKGFEELQAAVL